MFLFPYPFFCIKDKTKSLKIISIIINYHCYACVIYDRKLIFLPWNNPVPGTYPTVVLSVQMFLHTLCDILRCTKAQFLTTSYEKFITKYSSKINSVNNSNNIKSFKKSRFAMLNCFFFAKISSDFKICKKLQKFSFRDILNILK